MTHARKRADIFPQSGTPKEGRAGAAKHGVW